MDVLNNATYYISDDVLQFYNKGSTVGYLEHELPSGYNFAIVTYGSEPIYDTTEVLIGGVSKGTVENAAFTSNGQANFGVASGYYEDSDTVRIVEGANTGSGVALIESIKVCQV